MFTGVVSTHGLPPGRGRVADPPHQLPVAGVEHRADARPDQHGDGEHRQHEGDREPPRATTRADTAAAGDDVAGRRRRRPRAGRTSWSGGSAGERSSCVRQTIEPALPDAGHHARAGRGSRGAGRRRPAPADRCSRPRAGGPRPAGPASPAAAGGTRSPGGRRAPGSPSGGSSSARSQVVEPACRVGPEDDEPLASGSRVAQLAQGVDGVGGTAPARSPGRSPRGPRSRRPRPPPWPGGPRRADVPAGAPSATGRWPRPKRTRSRPSTWRTLMAATRCPMCGGSKVPPSTPTRRPPSGIDGVYGPHPGG